MSVSMTEIAAVLEKAADYIDAVENQKTAAEQQAKIKAASEIASKVTDATGEVLNEKIVEKLAAAAPEVADLLGKLAGGGVVDSLGGPESEHPNGVKTAEASMGDADQRFVGFLLS